jgi:hypothetical protein
MAARGSPIDLLAISLYQPGDGWPTSTSAAGHDPLGCQEFEAVA